MKPSEIISICKGLSCTASGSEKIHDLLEEEIDKKNLNVEIISTCCKGNCSESVNLNLLNSCKNYSFVDEKKVNEILSHIDKTDV